MLQRRDGGGIRCIQHMDVERALGCTERLPEHLRRETASPHPHHDAVGETLRDQLVPKALQLRNPFLHQVGDLQPTQAVADLFLFAGSIRRPQPRILLRDATHHRGLLELGEASLDLSLDGPELRLVGADVADLEPLLLVRDLREEFGDRIGKELHPVDLEVVGDLVHIDADGLQVAQHLPRTVDILEQADPHFAVFLEGHHGLLRHGVHGLRPDQFLDIHDVAVVGVLGPGARPQAALDAGAVAPELGELRLLEDSLERLVGHLGVRDRRIPQQLLQALALGRILGRGDFLFEQLVDGGVDAADEEARHRGDVDRLALLHASLQAPDEGTCDVLVDLHREHQRDVDVDPIGDALLDRRQPFVRCWDLDKNIGPPDPIEEVVGHRDRALGVVGDPRQDLDADVPVFVLGLFVDGLEHVRRQLDILDDQAQHDLFVGLAGDHQSLQRRVIVAAAADRLFEDGGVRGHADDGILLDHSLELTGRHQAPADVVEPDTGACLIELKQGVLGHRSSYGFRQIGPNTRLSHPTSPLCRRFGDPLQASQ